MKAGRKDVIVNWAQLHQNNGNYLRCWSVLKEKDWRVLRRLVIWIKVISHLHLLIDAYLEEKQAFYIFKIRGCLESLMKVPTKVKLFLSQRTRREESCLHGWLIAFQRDDSQVFE
jgi:hypothetical protein